MVESVTTGVDLVVVAIDSEVGIDVAVEKGTNV
jgi:hypothetical protein